MSAQPAVIARKHVNALIPEAVPAFMERIVPAGILGFFKRYGGIWLAGTVTLSSRTLSYVPNRFNRALYKNAGEIVFPLERVMRVSDRFGVLSGIVDVHLDDGSVFSFRCFGAQRFARIIAAALASNGGTALDAGQT